MNSDNKVLLLSIALDYCKAEEDVTGLSPGYVIHVAQAFEHYLDTGENPFDDDFDGHLQESLKGAEVV